jgi:hypothetical protein
VVKSVPGEIDVNSERYDDDPITTTEVVLMIGAVGLIAILLLMVIAAV